jgi:DNA-binding GntR family transcriptional regulator
LEIQAAHLAIVRNQVALARDLAPLVTRLQRAVTEEDTPAIGRLDTQVHRTIVAHADNAYLLRGYDMILPRAACLRAQLSRRLAHEPHWAFGDYENLAGYVRRGEIDRLIATLTDNSQRTGELYRQVFLDGAAPVDTEISRLRARLTGA